MVCGARLLCPYQRLYALSSVDIPSSQVNILDGNAENLIAECKAYEERIKSYGGVELFLAGIGADGHIAFNVSVNPYFLPMRRQPIS